MCNWIKKFIFVLAVEHYRKYWHVQSTLILRFD